MSTTKSEQHITTHRGITTNLVGFGTFNGSMTKPRLKPLSSGSGNKKAVKSGSSTAQRHVSPHHSCPFFRQTSRSSGKITTAKSCSISHRIYAISTYIWLMFMVNVGKYAIHGSYGFISEKKCGLPFPYHPYMVYEKFTYIYQ